jgi:serine protease Do
MSWMQECKQLSLVVIGPAVLLGAGFLASLAARSEAGASHNGTETTKSGSLAEMSEAFQRVARAVEPSVVHIRVKSGMKTAHTWLPDLRNFPGLPEEYHWFFQNPGPGEEPQGRLRRYNLTPDGLQEDDDAPGSDELLVRGAGSGWIYDAEGHVVTNNHVVYNAREITVRFHDGREAPAELVATDPATDIAVLKVAADAGELHPARLSDHDGEQGEIVFAFGSPLELQFSMSQGIVAGKNRQTGILGPTGYENFLQTDAVINPGNSGGPLTDIEGRVLGMNAAIATRTGLFAGVGFAIPVSMIRPVVEQLLNGGEVARGYLGVRIQDGRDLLETFGFHGAGVLVSAVLPGEPGDRAGLERGDIIVSLDGQPTESANDLRQRIAAKGPDTTVRLEIVRKGEQQELKVELGRLPEDGGASILRPHGTSSAQHEEESSLRELGIVQASALNAGLARELGIDDGPGVVVRRIRPGSAAQEAGLQEGMVITEVMDQPVSDVAALARALDREEVQRGVRLTVRYEGVERYLVLKRHR